MASSSEFQVVHNCTSVMHPLLAEPWVFEPTFVKDADGRDLIFAEVNGQNRKLARAFGLDVSSRAPFKETNMLCYLAKLRNLAVEEAIHAWKVAADPMSVASPAKNAASRGGAQRSREFDMAFHGKPLYVELKVLDFQLKVFASPRQDSSVCIEISPGSLECLAKGINMTWEVGSHAWKRKALEISSDVDLPKLEVERIKYRRRLVNKTVSQTLVGSYYDGHKWRIISRAIPHAILHGFQQQLTQHVKELESQIAEFLKKHHKDPDGITDDAAAVVNEDDLWGADEGDCDNATEA